MHILGEATGLVSPEVKARYPDIPWRNPVSLRNRVVHGHRSVDVEILHTSGGATRHLRRAVAEGPRRA
ncbi:MAG: hypothetical protein DLM60_07575 [Pseudonocardiales bacterium]|nr:MAG: hypothetical protein DLM60_07575 [Pseudonocardiales bacterium]